MDLKSVEVSANLRPMTDFRGVDSCAFFYSASTEAFHLKHHGKDLVSYEGAGKGTEASPSAVRKAASVTAAAAAEIELLLDNVNQLRVKFVLAPIKLRWLDSFAFDYVYSNSKLERIFLTSNFFYFLTLTLFRN